MYVRILKKTYKFFINSGRKVVKSKPFYRFLSLAFVAVFAGTLVFEYGRAEQADFKKNLKSLEWNLSILEARSAPAKARAGIKLKIQKVLKKYADRLKEDPVMISELILSQADSLGIDPLMILAVIATESSFRKHAVSYKGAIGLMQLRPLTARSIAQEVNLSYTHRSNLTDTRLNIMLGAYYLAKLRNKFGSFKLALEAYNRGPTRLRRQLRNGRKINHIYSNRVMYHYGKFQDYYSSL